MFLKSNKFKIFVSLTLAATFLFACGIFTPPVQEAVNSDPIPVDPTATAFTQNEESIETPSADPADENSNQLEPSQNLDDIFEAFWDAVEVLDRYYVDQPIDLAQLAEGAISGVQEAAEIEETAISDDLAEDFARASDAPGDYREAFIPFFKVWAAAEPKLGTQLARSELVRAAMSGMIDSLGDQHTYYMDPDQTAQASMPLDGTYEGIGAWVDPSGDFLTIVSPMPDSPAEQAGLEPGDMVIAVNGEDMTGIDGNLVIRRVLGPEGSDVTLTIRREGVEDFDVVITRAKIVIPSVDSYIIEDTNIAYVALFTFGDSTTSDLREALEDLLANNPDGLILDLRNNGGGYLDTSIEVASEFISEGVILSEVYGDGSRDTYDSLGEGLATEIPLVVLINGGSASASEIVAGAIHAYGRGILVGETSFGKGSVQQWIGVSDGGAVRVTIAKWLMPDDTYIHEIGIEPDVYVEFTEEDFSNNIDPQLDKAIELLTQP